MAASFPFFAVSGSSEQIGQQCGALFGDRIRSCKEFYVELLAEVGGYDLSDPTVRSQFLAQLRACTVPFTQAIQQYFPAIAVEIEAMASSAQLEPWELFFLNSRTEIYGKILAEKQQLRADVPSECTSLYSREHLLLGENWDWHPRVEEFSVVLQVTRSEGRRFVMLTEPGMVGKFGLNSAGVGVCLNILYADIIYQGVPVHVLLRVILESDTALEAHESVKRAFRGTSSNLLFADRGGDYFNIELRGSNLLYPFSDGDIVLHTNHYIDQEAESQSKNPSSFYRATRGRELYPDVARLGLAGFKQLLADSEVAEFPICRPYRQGVSFVAGTAAGVIMDLRRGELHIVRGRPMPDAVWQTFSLASA